MHTNCCSTSVLLPLFCALLAQAALIPTTTSIESAILLGLPVVNVFGTSSPASVASVPLSSRNIVLAFISKGQPIPENEVKDTLVEADLAINDLARNYPNKRIDNDRFEYRRPNGNMLIIIRTKLGEEITWMELNRVLQGLYRYMAAGVGTEQTHYQALEFEIEASGQEKPDIGLGLVWYFPPTESQVQKRVRLPPTMALDNEGTLPPLDVTSPRSSSKMLRTLPNATLALPGANNVQEAIIFPIPQTSLSLSFYFFGPSIPSQSVKATLQGAMAKVRPFLNGPSEMSPIENDAFRWVLPLSREAGIPVAVTVFTYHSHVITWRQLFDVLFGLYAFTTTFGTDLEEPHFQVLGFRIVDLSGSKLGVGTVSYFRSGISQLANTRGTNDNVSLSQPLGTPNISLFNPVMDSDSIVYPVANTDIILFFTFLGDTPIPPVEISAAISGAQQKIADMVALFPDNPIPGVFKDISTSGRMSTNIFVYSEKTITWKELDQVLTGLLHFCDDDQDHNHDRMLVFEIDLESESRGRVGFGTLLYVASDPVSVEERSFVVNDTVLRLPTNTVVSKPGLTSLTVPIPYPIPGTPITLTFTALGFPIPSVYVNAAFRSALRGIQNHVMHHPNTPIPNDQWDRRGEVSKVWITIIAYDGNKITWQELSYIIAALLHFMTETGEGRCCDLAFLIYKVGQVATGYGSVEYQLSEDSVFANTGQ